MRKIIPVVAAGVSALAVAGGTFGYVTSNRDVTLSVDGQATQVSTAARTVGDLLTAQGITIGSHDVVAPAPDAQLNDGTRVAVQFGRQVVFTVDGEQESVWTTATSLDQAMGALRVDTAGADLSTSRSSAIGRQGLRVDIDTRKTVTIQSAGKKRKITTTAATVGEALTDAKITPDSDDEVSIKTTTPLVSGVKVIFTRVDVTSVTKKSRIAYPVVRKSSATLEKGKTKISTVGRAGTRSVTYRVERHDGVIDSTKKTATKIATEPVAQVVLVGTKAAPAVASGGVWDKIAKCESGGNWSINTGNGYYGGLQFSAATWRSVGGTGLPSNHSREEQIKRAKILQARSGWGQWSCAGARFN